MQAIGFSLTQLISFEEVIHLLGVSFYKLNYQMGIEGVYTTYLWLILFKQVYFLKEQRQKNTAAKDLQGINISIIILLTTCIESFLYTILSDVLALESEYGKNLLSKRVIDDLKVQIGQASWSDLVGFTSIITGKKLNKYFSSLLWEKIGILFRLRNKLVHGKNIKKKISNLKDEYQEFYKDILKDLKRIKLVEKEQAEIFSIGTIDNFIKVAEDFIGILAKEISTQFDFENSDDFIHQKYESGLNYLENLR